MQHYCSTGKELVGTIYYTSKELGAHPHNLIHEQRITIVGPSNHNTRQFDRSTERCQA